jgi:hypothetical protein
MQDLGFLKADKPSPRHPLQQIDKLPNGVKYAIPPVPAVFSMTPNGQNDASLGIHAS